MEGLMLELHLVVDAVQVLLSAQNASGHTSLCQFFLNARLDLFDNFPVTAPQFFYRFGDIT